MVQTRWRQGQVRAPVVLPAHERMRLPTAAQQTHVHASSHSPLSPCALTSLDRSSLSLFPCLLPPLSPASHLPCFSLPPPLSPSLHTIPRRYYQIRNKYLCNNCGAPGHVRRTCDRPLHYMDKKLQALGWQVIAVSRKGGTSEEKFFVPPCRTVQLRGFQKMKVRRSPCLPRAHTHTRTRAPTLERYDTYACIAREKKDACVKHQALKQASEYRSSSKPSCIRAYNSSPAMPRPMPCPARTAPHLPLLLPPPCPRHCHPPAPHVMWSEIATCPARDPRQKMPPSRGGKRLQ